MPGKVVVNRGTAEPGGLKIGDTTVLRTPDPVRVTVVGLPTFGGEDGMAQVSYILRVGHGRRPAARCSPGLGARQVKASEGTGDTVFVFAPPPLRLLAVALVGLAAGALAGWRPARRAARLDVLRAIATE